MDQNIEVESDQLSTNCAQRVNAILIMIVKEDVRCNECLWTLFGPSDTKRFMIYEPQKGSNSA